MACSMDVPRIAEPALSCLHKLVYIHLKKLPTPLSKQVVSSAKQLSEQETVLAQVAHAYLHAESSPAGRLDDGSIVAQVHSLVSFPGHSVALVLELIEKIPVGGAPSALCSLARLGTQMCRLRARLPGCP